MVSGFAADFNTQVESPSSSSYERLCIPLVWSGDVDVVSCRERPVFIAYIGGKSENDTTHGE